MNRAIPNEIVEEIRARVDIVEVINDYAPLKKKGHTFEACCPFHTEKTPSFKVNPQNQMFYCFGCEAGGDVFKFVMDKENVDFPTAVHLLAERCNVIIPEKPSYNANNQNSNKWQQNQRNLRNRLYELHEFAKNEYQKNLCNNPNNAVVQYVKNRNMSSEGIEMFSLGASLNGFDIIQKANKAGFTNNELLQSGIAAEGKTGNLYDRFFNRLTFPIWNETGKVIGFSSRTVENDKKGAKYVNSPESMIFKKSNVLYALPLARKAFNELGFAILCEGQIDVMAMHLANYKNAVAPQGTALTDEQCRILKRYTDTIYFMFDSDNAGQKAIRRGIEIALPIGFDLKVVQMPAGKDPDEIFKAEGAEGIENIVNDAKDFFVYLMDYYCQGSVKNLTPADKGKIVNELLKFVQMIKNAVARAGYVTMLAEKLNISEGAIFSELNSYKKIVKKQTDYAQKREQISAQYQQRNQIQNNNSPSNQVNGEANNILPQQGINNEFVIDIPEKIKQAEVILLQYAIKDYDTAHMLSTQLPVELISKHPLGRALEEVIRVSVNGEHDLAVNYLAEFERNNSNELLRRLLLEPLYVINEKSKKKAIAECLFTVKLYALEQEKKLVADKLKKISSSEEEEILFSSYLKLDSEIKQLRVEHSSV
ncbi:DNA primase [Lentisphaerota bacterium WC36G]|nr:DNA primase [Lentisphaerae bacterium WC36]